MCTGALLMAGCLMAASVADRIMRQLDTQHRAIANQPYAMGTVQLPAGSQPRSMRHVSTLLQHDDHITDWHAANRVRSVGCSSTQKHRVHGFHKASADWSSGPGTGWFPRKHRITASPRHHCLNSRHQPCNQSQQQGATDLDSLLCC